MGPIIPLYNVSPELNLLVAFIIGLGFGIALEQAGFSSSRKLAGMFYGYDVTVIKVFFTAAITGMLGLIFLNYLNLIDLDIVYINQFYLYSSIVGGVIMGAGFIIGGFCPGTSFTAAAIGKIDGMWFVFGSVLGIFLFAETYPLWKTLYLSNNLGDVKISDALGMKDGIFAITLIVVAALMFWIGELAEKKFAREDITKEL